jgi:hypothetical protein
MRELNDALLIAMCSDDEDAMSMMGNRGSM